MRYRHAVFAVAATLSLLLVQPASAHSADEVSKPATTAQAPTPAPAKTPQQPSPGNATDATAAATTGGAAEAKKKNPAKWSACPSPSHGCDTGGSSH